MKKLKFTWTINLSMNDDETEEEATERLIQLLDAGLISARTHNYETEVLEDEL